MLTDTEESSFTAEINVVMYVMYIFFSLFLVVNYVLNDMSRQIPYIFFFFFLCGTASL